MSPRNLEDLLATVASPVELLRNSQAGPNVYPGVPAEYTNWLDEQQAWQKTCVLFNQTYHMADLAVEGPDALKLLSHLAVNSFDGFVTDRAKHFVPCTPDGYVIGDVILFALAENTLQPRRSGARAELDHATTRRPAATTSGSSSTSGRRCAATGCRKSYRFQVQGPNAMQVIEKVLGRRPPELRFFHMTTVTIAGRSVRALRHGMAGQPGWELFGPWDDREPVREAIVAAGEEFGLRQVGGRAYSSNTLESGWIPSPLPAVYSGESLQAVPGVAARRTATRARPRSAAASPRSSIEDYYFTPWDLGYGNYVKFDHDFIGREALERMAEGEHRQKVTLALDDDDVTRTIGTMFRKSGRAKFIDWPSAVYSMHPFDRVTVDGETVGVSTWVGYSANEGKMLTLAVLDAEYAEPGTEVTFVWGEEDGGSAKPTVEPHVQTEIGAVVSPVPYVEAVRKSYAPGGWRAGRA